MAKVAAVEQMIVIDREFFKLSMIVPEGQKAEIAINDVKLTVKLVPAKPSEKVPSEK